MKIYELIRKRNTEIKGIKIRYNTEIMKILKQWFPEYEISYDFGDVTFKFSDGYWCRFALSGAETFNWGISKHKEKAFRLKKNSGLNKEEIKSIKQRLEKLYEGAE